MRSMRTNTPLVLLALVTAGLLIALGCGDDGDPVGNDGDNGTSYGSPNGQYNVTSSNVNLTIDDWGNVPGPLQPFIEQWIKDIVDDEGSSTAEVDQQLLLLLKTESPICVALPYIYDADNRSCSTATPIDVEDFDVSSYDLCETVPLMGEHCVQTVSLAADIKPNLMWPSSFATFSGSEAIGSAQFPAEITVVVSGNLGDTFQVAFHASRNVSGKRCSDCSECPSTPTGPSPNGDWDVTSTNVNVMVTDNGGLPSELTPMIEQWITTVISNGGTSEWSIAQAAVVLSRTETDMCAPMVYVYNPFNRRCTISTPVDVEDIDVSALGLCQDILLNTYCLTKISLDADFTPNLQWAPDFDSFNGSELIGTEQNPASVTVTITGPVIGGDYNVEFFSSRNVLGTRCSGCTPCR